MRREFEITDEQVQMLKDANDPLDIDVITIVADGFPMTEYLQFRVNLVWHNLGEELGFMGLSALPIDDNRDDYNHFTALEKPCVKNLN